MKAQAAQIAIQSIQTKIQMLRENADVYIQVNGQQGYNEMLASLVSRMTRMGEEDAREMTTPVSVGYSLLAVLPCLAALLPILAAVVAIEYTINSVLLLDYFVRYLLA